MIFHRFVVLSRFAARFIVSWHCFVYLFAFVVFSFFSTPAMGWNSWNHFQCAINEDLIHRTAEAMVREGLVDAGYKYLNLDDCWQINRDADRFILEDRQAFPHGIAALSDFVHSKGLLFGLYSSEGTMTCQKRYRNVTRVLACFFP